ncbi:fibronectin type III domain-containing protein [Thalassomonas sp. M1454]|uniref:fibronectin type III domain-containing protein n=1 Tax=Thalassomonas sp. M1454 TaxID=2594477 RepID=UPI00117DCBF8|nr:fibronectin type III domain-containing protein [Thalassomonas sp. M1454]TRX53866.1 fibronectin type III domain-containing protein [Thalassomonas sp. M1454]
MNNNFKLLATSTLLTMSASFSTLLNAEEREVLSATISIEDDRYSLSNPLHNDKNSEGQIISTMTYDSSKVDELGAAFSMEYKNIPGTTGFDGYVQGAVGGVKYGGKWHPGDITLTGMPIQIKELDNSFRLQWKTFQQNAYDEDDQWWATINVILDSLGAHLQPNEDDRDFDVVIQLERYEQDKLTDKSKGNNSYWWFARNSDNSIKPFVLTIDGKEYHWGVRYKFFNYPEGHNNVHKNNKVHVKYIPIDNANVAPYLDHPLKTFVDSAKDYLQFTDLPAEELSLANEKMDDELWIKSVRAGYEVYTGESTLGNEYFRTEIDMTPPEAPTDLALDITSDKLVLTWQYDSIDDPIEHYIVYRSVNGSAFEPVDMKVYTKEYIDLDISEGNSYEYYVTATDRSFNISQDSDVVDMTGEIVPTPTTPDPTTNPTPEVEEPESDSSSGGGSLVWLLASGLLILRRNILKL